LNKIGRPAAHTALPEGHDEAEERAVEEDLFDLILRHLVLDRKLLDDVGQPNKAVNAHAAVSEFLG
jgi:hypothetical protein